VAPATKTRSFSLCGGGSAAVVFAALDAVARGDDLGRAAGELELLAVALLLILCFSLSSRGVAAAGRLVVVLAAVRSLHADDADGWRRGEREATVSMPTPSFSLLAASITAVSAPAAAAAHGRELNLLPHPRGRLNLLGSIRRGVVEATFRDSVGPTPHPPPSWSSPIGSLSSVQPQLHFYHCRVFFKENLGKLY